MKQNECDPWQSNNLRTWWSNFKNFWGFQLIEFVIFHRRIPKVTHLLSANCVCRTQDRSDLIEWLQQEYETTSALYSMPSVLILCVVPWQVSPMIKESLQHQCLATEKMQDMFPWNSWWCYMLPDFDIHTHIHLSNYLSICLSIYLSIHLSFFLSLSSYLSNLSNPILSYLSYPIYLIYR